jgi:hypothetical protein
LFGFFRRFRYKFTIFGIKFEFLHMRSLIISIISLFFLLLVGQVNGQYFNGGIMAGVAGTQVAGDTYSGFHKAGIYAGGFVNLQISQRSIFQLELEFFQKGSRKNPNYENDDLEQYLFRVNYVEMPVLYQYVVNERLKLEVGPSLGFLTGYYEEKNSEEIKAGNRPARVTLQINAGMYVSITRRLMFNLRTNNSLLNIRSDNATGDVLRIIPGNYGQFNDGLVMSIAYQFRDAW